MERIQIKRVCEPPAKTDGFRVLVDRVSPRGLTNSDAAADLWMKEVAPTTLRKWFNHDRVRWKAFQENSPTTIWTTVKFGAPRATKNAAIAAARNVIGRRTKLIMLASITAESIRVVCMFGKARS